MEDLNALVERNRLRAINLMRANNIDTISFLDIEQNCLIKNVPTVLTLDNYEVISDLLVARVKLDSNNDFHILVVYEDAKMEKSLDEIYATENNIYVGIEQYFIELKNKQVNIKL